MVVFTTVFKLLFITLCQQRLKDFINNKTEAVYSDVQKCYYISRNNFPGRIVKVTEKSKFSALFFNLSI